MKRNTKQFLLILGIIAVALFSRRIFHIDQKIFFTCVYSLAIAAVIGVIGYNLLFVRPYRKHVRQQRELLQNGHAEEALEQMQVMEKELERKHMTGTAQLCKLNMAAAYSDLHRYEEGLAMLQSISDDRFSGISECVYKLNICMFLLYLGREDEALEAFEADRKLFDTFHTHDNYGGKIAVLKMYAYLRDGEIQKARELLDRARIAWNDPRMSADYSFSEAV